jgi:alpha-ketoglutarate-dependent taurine dioxygenase
MEISFDPNDQTKYRTAKVNQPLHTDYSYIDVNNTIQFLMCIKKAQLGGATTFIDTKLLVDMLLMDKNENLYNRLLNIPVNHLKGNKSKISPILIKDNLDFKINWNYPPAKKGENSKEAILLIEEFKEWLDSRVEKSGLLTSVLLENNDIVFFHDYYVLHGRNCYFANVIGDRKLIKGSLVL